MSKKIDFGKRTTARASAPAKMDAPAALRSLFARQDEIRNAMRYNMLGAVVDLATPHGRLEFPQAMFGLAITKELVDERTMTVLDPGGEPLLIGTWPGLADLDTTTDEPCTACLIKCTACLGEKKFRCLVCGGEAGPKKLRTGNTICCPDCKKSPEGMPLGCATCTYSGKVNIYIDCKHCKTTGMTACSVCRGSGQESCGLDTSKCDPAKVLKMMQKAEVCAVCRGKMKKLETTEQQLDPHIQSVFEGNTIVGPIERFTLLREGYADKNGFLPLFTKRDAIGYEMHLVIAGTGDLRRQSGNAIYCLHGEFDMSAFNESHQRQFGSR